MVLSIGPTKSPKRFSRFGPSNSAAKRGGAEEAGGGESERRVPAGAGRCRLPRRVPSAVRPGRGPKHVDFLVNGQLGQEGRVFVFFLGG